MHKHLLILSCFLTVFITSSSIVHVNIASGIKHTSLLPIEDTYAASNHPTRTHGNSEQLSFGDFNNRITEIFLSFEISSKYRNLTSAELQIQGIGFDSGNETHSYPIKGNVSLISDNWDEATLNWENKPSPLQEIAELHVKDFSWSIGYLPIFFTINVTDAIQFVNGNHYILSVCINIIVGEPERFGYLAIPSKEGHDNITFFGPLLHITYIEEPMDDPPDPPILPIIIGIASAVGVALGVGGGLGYFYYRKKRQSLSSVTQLPSYQAFQVFFDDLS